MYPSPWRKGYFQNESEMPHHALISTFVRYRGLTRTVRVVLEMKGYQSLNNDATHGQIPLMCTDPDSKLREPVCSFAVLPPREN